MTAEAAIDEFILPEEEGIFARDIDGQLVRMDKVTADDFEKSITIKIDGREVTVKKAVPLTDSQGTIMRDADGGPIPRATTVYDAASQLFARKIGEENPIPILCHQEHLNPVAVCRVCAVEIARVKRGQMQRERKLLPACQHRVEETMEVQTIASPDLAARKRVHSSVQMLVEMLLADHLPGKLEEQPQYNELARLARRLNTLALEAHQLEKAANPAITAPDLEAKWPLVNSTRFAPRKLDRGSDDSSSMIHVEHNACILCDRCVRACDDIKKNVVIGRTGKGYSTAIGFDLNDPMGQSSCVSCGECMISCPTGALTYKGKPREAKDDRRGEPISVDELKRYPIFAGIPYKFLAWNADSVRRVVFNRGDVLCREGEQGTTAYLLMKGRYGISIAGAQSTGESQPGRLRAFVNKMTGGWMVSGRRLAEGHRDSPIRIDGGTLSLAGGKWVGECSSDDLIIGEMACMNHYPRSATVVALEPGEVLEINRNVLYMLQRNRQSRDILDNAYRARALVNELRNLTLLKDLDEKDRAQCAEFLRDHAELIRVDRGQVIFRQGDRANDFFQVRLGFVKVSQEFGGQQRVLSYLGPGKIFGEIGLLSAMVDLGMESVPRGTRTATCTALDDVELVRLRGQDFRELWQRFPAMREEMITRAKELLRRNDDSLKELAQPLGDFLQQGLYSAQKLLVLDLESCTRCDECTRACADTHDGVTRLIREGLRFENFLIASACRSCLDPYCLVGCPVDAIHRKQRDNHHASLEIVIEDHCIGCGQCARNCPYGNINMHPTGEHRVAITCDLCRDLVGPNDDPSCVYACPHSAAFRMSGPELQQVIKARHG